MHSMGVKGSRKNNPDWEKVSKEQTGNTRDSWRKKVRPAAVGNTKNSGKAQDDFSQGEHNNRISLIDTKIQQALKGETFPEGMNINDAEKVAKYAGMDLFLHQDGKGTIMTFPHEYHSASDHGYVLVSLDEKNNPVVSVSTGENGNTVKGIESFIDDTTWENIRDIPTKDQLKIKARQITSSSADVEYPEDLAEKISKETDMEVWDVTDELVDYEMEMMFYDKQEDKYYKMYGAATSDYMYVNSCVEMKKQQVSSNTFSAEHGDNLRFESPEVNEFLVALSQFSASEGSNWGNGNLDLKDRSITELAYKMGMDVIEIVPDDDPDSDLNPEGTGILTTSYGTNKQNGRRVEQGYLIGDEDSGEYVAVQTRYASEGYYDDIPDASITMAGGKPVLSGDDMWKVTRSGSSKRFTWVSA